MDQGQRLRQIFRVVHRRIIALTDKNSRGGFAPSPKEYRLADMGYQAVFDRDYVAEQGICRSNTWFCTISLLGWNMLPELTIESLLTEMADFSVVQSHIMIPNYMEIRMAKPSGPIWSDVSRTDYGPDMLTVKEVQQRGWIFLT